MNKFFKDIMKDKDGNYNLREITTVIFILITIINWVVVTFCSIHVAEFMFYSIISLVGAGCFGYTIERRSKF